MSYYGVRNEAPHADDLLFGGYLTGENVYIQAYPEPLPGRKHPRDLEPGETTRVTYKLSGEKRSTPCVVWRLTPEDCEREGLIQ